MYQALRSRGHEHARFLRSVADRLLNIACAPRRRLCFNPHRAGPGSPAASPWVRALRAKWGAGGAAGKRFLRLLADTSGTARADTITFRLSLDATTGQ